MTDTTTTATTWWDDPTTDWGDPGPNRLVLLLRHAYPDADDVRRIAFSLRLDPAGLPDGTPVPEAWIAVLTAASRREQVLDLVATVLHDQAVSEFHAPLRNLLGNRLGEVNARILLRHGLPAKPTDGEDVFVESIRTAAPVSGRHGELQAITAPSVGIPNARAYMRAVDDLLRRTALVEVGGAPAGTGFLVGEDLLLTAAHVLDKYHWPPDPLRPVRAVFDYEYAGLSAAETGIRVPVKEFIVGSLPTQGEAAGVVGANSWDAPADRLDFALLRLAHAAPDRAEYSGTARRGYYELLADGYNFAGTPWYFIVHHALGEFVQLSPIAVSPQMSKSGTRMRYGGNTQPGSSGSAIVDFRGRLVGLHHLGTGERNQGIPISVIAGYLLGGEHARLFDKHVPVGVDHAMVQADARVVEVDPFGATAVLRRPFVNRHNLRRFMREMAEDRDSYRTLVINGASSRSGVSYSYQLASHVSDQAALCATLRAAAPGGIKVVKIDLRDFLKVGVERARTDIGLALLLEFGIISGPSDDAQAARGTATLVATLSAKLRRSDAQWWIFFDSLDNVQVVKHGEVDELIHALVKLADDVPVPLRVVVAGREAQKFTDEHTAWAARDAAAGLTRGDVEGWLRKRADEELRIVDEAKLAGKLASLFPPGPLPEPESLALSLPAALEDVLAP